MRERLDGIEHMGMYDWTRLIGDRLDGLILIGGIDNTSCRTTLSIKRCRCGSSTLLRFKVWEGFGFQSFHIATVEIQRKQFTSFMFVERKLRTHTNLF